MQEPQVQEWDEILVNFSDKREQEIATSGSWELIKGFGVSFQRPTISRTGISHEQQSDFQRLLTHPSEHIPDGVEVITHAQHNQRQVQRELNAMQRAQIEVGDTILYKYTNDDDSMFAAIGTIVDRAHAAENVHNEEDHDENYSVSWWRPSQSDPSGAKFAELPQRTVVSRDTIMASGLSFTKGGALSRCGHVSMLLNS